MKNEIKELVIGIVLDTLETSKETELKNCNSLSYRVLMHMLVEHEEEMMYAVHRLYVLGNRELIKKYDAFLDAEDTHTDEETEKLCQCKFA